MKWNKRIGAVCFIGALTAAICGAQPKDLPNSKDHPLVTRYPGSVIDVYSVVAFDEFNLPLGKLQGQKFDKSQHLEGKITRIGYAVPAGRSILEVFRNYESALQRGGFTTLFSCANDDGCGSNSAKIITTGNDDWSWSAGQRAISAKLARAEGDVYVSMHIGQWSHLEQGSSIMLYVVEIKPMEGGLVTVDAAALASDITRSGHAAVYGIYFDTAKAEVKPESDAALKEIAKLLQQTPALKLFVVGHTDGVGTLASNMDLSKRRADAVVAALTTKYGVAAARLVAQGCGPLAPVVSNASEDGRAKNRRVELVAQ
jgi:outer membrane protein OmpA-like peptidoglycan-associated protein